jgi:hypothetical protein
LDGIDPTTMTDPSAWCLRIDLFATRAILLIVTARRDVDLQPHVHLYLTDRYRRLAWHHHTHGHARRAEALLLKAKEHLHLGGGDQPPPTAALAMPVPQRPTFTQAIGRWSDEEPPDPAA